LLAVLIGLGLLGGLADFDDNDDEDDFAFLSTFELTELDCLFGVNADLLLFFELSLSFDDLSFSLAVVNDDEPLSLLAILSSDFDSKIINN